MIYSSGSKWLPPWLCGVARWVTIASCITTVHSPTEIPRTLYACMQLPMALVLVCTFPHVQRFPLIIKSVYEKETVDEISSHSSETIPDALGDIWWWEIQSPAFHYCLCVRVCVVVGGGGGGGGGGYRIFKIHK